MLSPEGFDREYSTAELTQALPESPIASLRNLQYLYGKLYTLATAGSGEYASYLTPDAARDLLGTDDSLIVIRVDLSHGGPQLADDERGPVWVTRYTTEQVTKVAHCRYPAARGLDHSVTHQAGRNSGSEKLARYAQERVAGWPNDEVVQGVAETHEQGWVINALATLGEDETALNTIERAVKRELDGDSATALLTIQVRLTDDEPYRWPGDLDVFLQAMQQRKLSKLVSKNGAEDSSGDAVDLVTGNAVRTVGTAEDPQNYFLSKQLEKFPNLDIEEAWRTHPISEDTAVTIMNSEAFLEACTHRMFGAKVYYLPYFFGTQTPEDARKLYTILHQLINGNDDRTPVEETYEEHPELADEKESLRFYTTVVMPHQMSRYDVFGEAVNSSLYDLRTLAMNHIRITETSAFTPTGELSAPIPTSDSWDLLVPSDEMLHTLSTGRYFEQTFAERDDSGADADDPRIRALISVLNGNPISVDMVLKEYVSRIIADEHDDDVERFPSFRVASQFAQLCALAGERLDLLTTDDPQKEPITEEPSYRSQSMAAHNESSTTIADGGDNAAAKLNAFIEDTPALSDDERRSVFLLGTLVGEVGSYQVYIENQSTTLIDTFPAQSISRRRIKKTTQRTIEKALTYARAEGQTLHLFEHVISRLRETILHSEPDNWQISTDDLRFYYALGITYGIHDHRDWDSSPTNTTSE